ncbi:MAG TPA: DNRLRE domain-containing protein [Tepidisphaeraceae bacterium]|jgi:uncharacterized delta-60 repeat protein|nr:DNRLRE domain-containing protein [Tepidisphaeraceae bacterium]
MRKKSGYRSVRAAVVETLEKRRLLSAGALDTTFGTGGKVTYQSHLPSAMTVQSDGKIVVATVGGKNFTVSRYLANGKLDTSFGPNKTGLESLHVGPANKFDSIGGMAIQSDGKIIVGGSVSDDTGLNSVGFVARLVPGGALDTSFNKQGYTLQVTDGNVYAVAIQHDGKIIAAGSVDAGILSIPIVTKLMAFRLNSTGSVDSSFGDGGRTIISNGDENQEFNAIAIDYNGTGGSNSDFGKIILAGSSLQGTSSKSRMVVARLNSNGKSDNSFAGDGRFALQFPGHNESEANGVIVQPGGKIVIGGDAAGLLGSGSSHFVMARFLSNGTLDKTFGAAKSGLVDLDLGPVARGVTGMVSGAAQYLILGGTIGGQFALAAFTPDGIADSSFGTNGVAKAEFSGQTAALTNLALGPNQTIVAAGGVYNTQLDLARFAGAVPKVSLYSVTSTAKENGQTGPARFEVFRDAALPYATRVYFTVGGTAKLKTDYTGITLKPQVNSQAFAAAVTVSGVKPAIVAPPIAQIGYVDIPAGQKTADVNIFPIDRGVTTNKTVQLQLFGSDAYDINGDVKSTTITIIGDGAKPPPVTFETLKPTADAFVQDGTSANTNFGTAKTLQVKDSISVGSNRQSYLKFSLAGISSVASATLVLDGALNNSDVKNVLMQVFGVTNTTWSETGITWNNKPALNSTETGDATLLNTTENEYVIDVTPFVRAQFVAGNKTVSLAIKNPATSSPAGVFSSREGAAPPNLIIIN